MDIEGIAAIMKYTAEDSMPRLYKDGACCGLCCESQSTLGRLAIPEEVSQFGEPLPHEGSAYCKVSVAPPRRPFSRSCPSQTMVTACGEARH